MYEQWTSDDEARAAIGKRRRERANRRTVMGTFGAFVLAWLLNVASVEASVGSRNRDAAARQMVTSGVAIALLILAAVVFIAVARWVDTRRWLQTERLGQSGVPKFLHAVGWFGVLLMVVGPIGWGVSAFYRPVGLPRLESASAVALALLAITVSAAFVFRPADVRRAVTQAVLAESAAAERWAAFTPGELIIHERLAELELMVGRSLRSAPQRSPSAAPTAGFDTWGAWWRARPRRCVGARSARE